MNNLVTHNHPASARAAAPLGSGAPVPLGTAAWYRSDGHAVRPFTAGDLWLGRLAEGFAGQPVGFRDDRHVLLCAGTRSGKGTSFLIPNLCMWLGSAFVLDPKGENAVVTARARGRGSRYSKGMKKPVYVFDPFNAVVTEEDDFADIKCSFNPLDMIEPGREDAIDVAAKIIDSLMISQSQAERFWDDSAKPIGKGIILHVRTSHDFLPEERNLITVRNLVMRGYADITKFCGTVTQQSSIAMLARAMKKNKAFGGEVALIGAMLEDLLASEKTRMGVFQVLRNNLDFVASPGMQRCLSRSDFALSDLKTHPRGISVYVCLQDGYMETHFRFLRMMLMLTMHEMYRVSQKPASGFPVLMMLDEFASLERMRAIENAAAQIAGAGMKMVFTVQNLAQLKEIYRDNWETMVSNAGVKLFFCNDDHFTRSYVSSLIGEQEVIRTVRSTSATAGTSESRSESQTHGTSFSATESESTTTSGLGDLSKITSSHTYGRSVTTSATSSATKSVAFGSSHSKTSGASEVIHKRPLVTPDEVGRIFGDRDRPSALVIVSGHQPIFLRRTFYYQERALAGYYDWHPHHARPLTVDVARAQHAQDKIDYERQKARDAQRLKAQEEARREALLRAQEEARVARIAAEMARRDAEREAAQHRMEEEAKRAREERLDRLFRWSALPAAALFALLLKLIFG